MLSDQIPQTRYRSCGTHRHRAGRALRCHVELCPHLHSLRNICQPLKAAKEPHGQMSQAHEEGEKPGLTSRWQTCIFSRFLQCADKHHKQGRSCVREVPDRQLPETLYCIISNFHHRRASLGSQCTPRSPSVQQTSQVYIKSVPVRHRKGPWVSPAPSKPAFRTAVINCLFRSHWDSSKALTHLAGRTTPDLKDIPLQITLMSH